MMYEYDRLCSACVRVYTKQNNTQNDTHVNEERRKQRVLFNQFVRSEMI